VPRLPHDEGGHLLLQASAPSALRWGNIYIYHIICKEPKSSRQRPESGRSTPQEYTQGRIIPFRRYSITSGPVTRADPDACLTAVPTEGAHNIAVRKMSLALLSVRVHMPLRVGLLPLSGAVGGSRVRLLQ
jgi:hypothetical protein